MNIKYELKRTNRKTIGLTIRKGELFVNAPMRVSVAEIERFILKKRDWIEKCIKKSKFLSDVIAYKTILVKGKEVPLYKCGENRIGADGVYLCSFKNLKELYVSTFGDEFMQKVEEACRISGLKYKSVSFKDYASRWGCCDRRGNIIFNYKLMMLPEKLWYCVIVHELCHTVYMNHSPKFHALCNKIMPSYNIAHKQLNCYSSVCSLYR